MLLYEFIVIARPAIYAGRSNLSTSIGERWFIYIYYNLLLLKLSLFPITNLIYWLIPTFIHPLFASLAARA